MERVSREEKAEFVYRVSTTDEWEELQKTGAAAGGDLDRSTGCIHLSDLHQVKMVLKKFFQPKEGLFLLQISTAESQPLGGNGLAEMVKCLLDLAASYHPFPLGEGLIYEEVEGIYFPHFYGPSRSFVPLPLDAVTKAEKLDVKKGEFTCGLLDDAVVKSSTYKVASPASTPVNINHAS